MIKFLSALILLLVTTAAQAERIRDLTSVQGVRQNSLIGYGLVVGLDGTGDQTTQTPFTTQTLNNMLSQLGITVPTGTNMQLKNVAAVMVTASLPPFGRQGQTIDVVVSSMGNAKSLRGGTLLMTPLSDNRNGQALLDLQSNSKTVGGAKSFNDAYASLVSDIGNKTATLKTSSTTQGNVVTQLSNQQQSISGVNLDEEYGNLQRFQQYYLANAQVLQTANAIFDALINIR